MYDEKRYKLLFEAYLIKSIYNKIISTTMGEQMLEKLCKKRYNCNRCQFNIFFIVIIAYVFLSHIEETKEYFNLLF